jgi:hypothetical protein
VWSSTSLSCSIINSERQEMLSIIKGSLDHQEREGRGGEASISLPPPAGGEPNEIQIISKEEVPTTPKSAVRKGISGDSNGDTSKLVATTDDKSSLLAPSNRTVSHSPPQGSLVELPGTPSTPTNVAPVASASGGDIRTTKVITGHVSISEQPQLATATPITGPSPVPPLAGNYASNNLVNGAASSTHHISTQPSSRAGTPPVNGYKYSVRPPLAGSSTTAMGVPTMSREDSMVVPHAIPVPAGAGDESMLLNGARTKVGEHGNAKLSDAEITLDVILAHPVTVEMLKDRLATLHAPETLIFYLEVQAYKVAPLIHLKRMASDIYDTYIHVGAENQVNFSSTLRELISKRVKESRPNHMIFKEAEREAHRLIMQNVWPSFRDSHEFKVSGMILRGLVAPPDRPRGISIHWQAGGGGGGSSGNSQNSSEESLKSQASNASNGSMQYHIEGKE